jgi:hypothetical protein
MQAEAVQCEGQGDSLFRFCQQCGKLELLSRFEGNKRSCRSSLSKRRIASAGMDEPVALPAMLSSSSGSSSIRVRRSRAVKRNKPSSKSSTQDGSAEAALGNHKNNEAPAQNDLIPAVQPAAAAAAAAAPDDGACAADVAAALAEVLTSNMMQELDSCCQFGSPTAANSSWQRTPTLQQQQQQSIDLEVDELLQSDMLFDMCTAMEAHNGSCCSCSSTHDINSEHDLEQLLEHELRAAAAAAATNRPPVAAAAAAAAAAPSGWPSGYAYRQQQAAVLHACFGMLGSSSGFPAVNAEGYKQCATMAVTPGWQQQQQQQVHNVPGMPVTAPCRLDESNASALRQRLTHLQEMQQHLEELQHVLASVQLRRQQAAALLMAADAAAAAAVVVAPDLGVQGPVLQRSLTLQSSNNNGCGMGHSWGALV